MDGWDKPGHDEETIRLFWQLSQGDIASAQHMVDANHPNSRPGLRQRAADGHTPRPATAGITGAKESNLFH